ncbi:leucine rich repeat protein [Ichthyophthirius multifiliis]|uniref:Leucine rich repeat protein n=1 Tax=Ichthyophthirius multifiliis TaxID=5932 RepID=G0QSC4_ICHMU|nr:leucine rich repeat protein [Ichthyophthirius multifiliis]EGR31871.1 leucine rich repeat protein [Ichthyophthirius multifiliis]|eukprot:XP_004035357.1 leucine rich repeat protein [Ichthyophthirius multifiliis]
MDIANQNNKDQYEESNSEDSDDEDNESVQNMQNNQNNNNIDDANDNQNNKFSNIISNLESISFDSSVCKVFEELPLNFEYYSNIQCLSFDGTIKKQQTKELQKTSITFENMYPYSLKNLKCLKLKGCELTEEFFNSLQYMECINKIQILVFNKCNVHLKAFKSFITNQNLTNLKYLSLQGTQIDDHFCSIISDRSSVAFDLEAIDISNNVQNDKNIQKIIQKRQKSLQNKLKKARKHVPKITSINFNGCENVTSSLIEDLFRHRFLNNLQYLDLSYSGVQF